MLLRRPVSNIVQLYWDWLIVLFKYHLLCDITLRPKEFNHAAWLVPNFFWSFHASWLILFLLLFHCWSFSLAVIEKQKKNNCCTLGIGNFSTDVCGPQTGTGSWLWFYNWTLHRVSNSCNVLYINNSAFGFLAFALYSPVKMFRQPAILPPTVNYFLPSSHWSSLMLTNNKCTFSAYCLLLLLQNVLTGCLLVYGQWFDQYIHV